MAMDLASQCAQHTVLGLVWLPASMNSGYSSYHSGQLLLPVSFSTPACCATSTSSRLLLSFPPPGPPREQAEGGGPRQEAPQRQRQCEQPPDLQADGGHQRCVGRRHGSRGAALRLQEVHAAGAAGSHRPLLAQPRVRGGELRGGVQGAAGRAAGTGRGGSLSHCEEARGAAWKCGSRVQHLAITP